MSDKKAPATKVVTGKSRFSYVHVFEPYAFDSAPDKAQYSVCILIPKSDKDTLGRIKAALDAAKQDGLKKWGGKVPSKMWNPIRDGDEEHPEDEAFVGHYYLNAKSNQRPGLVDANRNPIIDQDEFYSGCFGRASVTFFPFSAAGNNGIGCALNNLQKLADGEPLSTRASAQDDFGDDEEVAEDDDFQF